MKSAGGPLGGASPQKKPRLDVGVNLQELFPEVLLKIFERVADKTDLQSLSFVCKFFNELIQQNPRVWHQLKWRDKNSSYLKDIIDEELPFIRDFELLSGDVAAFLKDGSFSVLPVMGGEWRNFPGHLNPDNFHIALPIKTIVSLNNNLLATCADNGIIIWSRLTGRLVRHLPCQHENDKPFKLLPMGNNRLLSASADGSIYLYDDYQEPARALKCKSKIAKGKLWNISFWGEDIIAEFDYALVVWGKHGKRVQKIVLTDEIEHQLTQFIADYLNTPQILGARPEDIAAYHHAGNRGMRLCLTGYYWDHKIQAILNNTFVFAIDLHGKAPIFLGIEGKLDIALQNNTYTLLRYFGAGLWRAYCGPGVDKVLPNYPQALQIPGVVNFFCVQPEAYAFFVLQDGRALRWDIKTNVPTYFILSSLLENDADDFYNFGSTSWKFHALVNNELIGLHHSGAVIIWDMNTGLTIQEFDSPYPCDPAKPPGMLQMNNQNIIINKFREIEVDEDGEMMETEKHICIYRFMSNAPANVELPPLPPIPDFDDALVEDFDILPPSPRR